MNHLYFVRHGENKANLTREFSFRKVDYPLTTKGALQAGQTAAYFEGRPVHAIYASPLKRARETAQIIGARLGLSVTLIEALREIHCGDLEGRTAMEDWALYNRIIEAWYAGHVTETFPGGEDYLCVWGRFRAALEFIFEGQDERHVIVVGHGGIFTAVLKDLCPAIDLDWLRDAESNNCSITDIALDDRLRGELITWGACEHLSGEAAALVPGIPKFK
jgi:probable phosphoglycerate mutase